MDRTVIERFCDKRFKYGPATCKRTPKHLGLHRDARTFRHATIHWGDNECAPDEEQQRP